MKWRTRGMFSNISWPYALEILDAENNVLGIALYQDRTNELIRYKFGEKILTLKHDIREK